MQLLMLLSFEICLLTDMFSIPFALKETNLWLYKCLFSSYLYQTELVPPLAVYICLLIGAIYTQYKNHVRFILIASISDPMVGTKEAFLKFFLSRRMDAISSFPLITWFNVSKYYGYKLSTKLFNLKWGGKSVIWDKFHLKWSNC